MGILRANVGITGKVWESQGKSGNPEGCGTVGGSSFMRGGGKRTSLELAVSCPRPSKIDLDGRRRGPSRSAPPPRRKLGGRPREQAEADVAIVFSPWQAAVVTESLATASRTLKRGGGE